MLTFQRIFLAKGDANWILFKENTIIIVDNYKNDLWPWQIRSASSGTDFVRFTNALRVIPTTKDKMTLWAGSVAKKQLICTDVYFCLNTPAIKF